MMLLDVQRWSEENWTFIYIYIYICVCVCEKLVLSRMSAHTFTKTPHVGGSGYESGALPADLEEVISCLSHFEVHAWSCYPPDQCMVSFCALLRWRNAGLVCFTHEAETQASTRPHCCWSQRSHHRIGAWGLTVNMLTLLALVQVLHFLSLTLFQCVRLTLVHAVQFDALTADKKLKVQAQLSQNFLVTQLKYSSGLTLSASDSTFRQKASFLCLPLVNITWHNAMTSLTYYSFIWVF